MSHPLPSSSSSTLLGMEACDRCNRRCSEPSWRCPGGTLLWPGADCGAGPPPGTYAWLARLLSKLLPGEGASGAPHSGHSIMPGRTAAPQREHCIAPLTTPMRLASPLTSPSAIPCRTPLTKSPARRVGRRLVTVGWRGFPYDTSLYTFVAANARALTRYSLRSHRLLHLESKIAATGDRRGWEPPAFGYIRKPGATLRTGLSSSTLVISSHLIHYTQPHPAILRHRRAAAPPRGRRAAARPGYRRRPWRAFA